MLKLYIKNDYVENENKVVGAKIICNFSLKCTVKNVHGE